MNNWGLWSYSTSLATITTAVSFFFYSSAGEFVVLPGMMMELITNGLLLLFVRTGDDHFTVPSGAFLVFNVIFYACMFYVVVALSVIIMRLQRGTKSICNLDL